MTIKDVCITFNACLSKPSCILIAAGPLCVGRHRDTSDRRLDDRYATFKKFNRTLDWTCEKGDAAILEITPNSSWPDVVYYNSFTHANMGWKIHIVDTYNRKSAATASALPSFGCYFFIMCAFLMSVNYV